MKKTSFFLLCTSLFIYSCNKDEITNESNNIDRFIQFPDTIRFTNENSLLVGEDLDKTGRAELYNNLDTIWSYTDSNYEYDENMNVNSRDYSTFSNGLEKDGSFILTEIHNYKGDKTNPSTSLVKISSDNGSFITRKAIDKKLQNSTSMINFNKDLFVVLYPAKNEIPYKSEIYDKDLNIIYQEKEQAAYLYPIKFDFLPINDSYDYIFIPYPSIGDYKNQQTNTHIREWSLFKSNLIKNTTQKEWHTTIYENSGNEINDFGLVVNYKYNFDDPNNIVLVLYRLKENKKTSEYYTINKESGNITMKRE